MDYDVFLSHNSKDKPAVEQIGHFLTKEYGLRCWLDKWNLVPGEPWQEGLENALDQCQAVAVFVGASPISPWENEEMRSALEARVSNKERRVIPVLLPGAPDSQELKLPRFLTRLTWVDFRSGLNDKNALYRLYCGIQGIRPGTANQEEQQTRGLSLGRRITTQLWRWRRSRKVWIPAIVLLLFVITFLSLSDLYVDVPLFCGKKLTSASAYIYVATQQRDNGYYACAAKNLNRGLSLASTPNDKARIYYSLASILIAKENPAQALEYIELGLTENADSQPLLHLTKGIAYCQMKQNAVAVQEFDTYLA
jgi:hypothetical protein